MDANHANLITLPRFDDERGSLSFAQIEEHIPFTPKRIYYLYNLKQGIMRGGHGHKNLAQLIVAFNGSLEVKVHNKKEWVTFRLTSPEQAVYIPANHWREIIPVQDGVVCLVVASEVFDADDYIHDFDNFINER